MQWLLVVPRFWWLLNFHFAEPHSLHFDKGTLFFQWEIHQTWDSRRTMKKKHGALGRKQSSRWKQGKTLQFSPPIARCGAIICHRELDRFFLALLGGRLRRQFEAYSVSASSSPFVVFPQPSWELGKLKMKFLMGKSTISMAIFNSYVNCPFFLRLRFWTLAPTPPMTTSVG